MGRLPRRHVIAPFTAAALVWCAAGSAAASDPWADTVTDYVPGSNSAPGYSNPFTAVGSPERFTGEGVFPGAVTIVNPAFGADEIVSIGAGGRLTMHFDEPVVDDPGHLYGVDLIVFGNAGFIASYPDGHLTDPAVLFGSGGASVEVSANGIDFFPVTGLADALFPTQGYLDVPPFDAPAGNAPTDFLKPVNPALTLSAFDGLTYAQVLSLYDGSGGGTPIDIGPTGLSSIQYVRISLPEGAALSAEIDALAAVPEPSSIALAALAITITLRKRRPRHPGLPFHGSRQ